MKTKYLYYFFFWLISISASASGKNQEVEIAMSIDDVQSLRVGKYLVRYVHYNRMEMPMYVFELIKTPKRVLLDKVYVNAVTVDVEGMKQELDFYNQTMAEIKRLEIQNGKLMFKLEYISGESHGGYYLANCTIGITNNKFDKPECKVIKREPN